MRNESLLLACFLAACDGGSALPDAPSDSPADTTADASYTPVQVTALSWTGDGVPETPSNASDKDVVLFLDPSGALLSQTTCDAQGHASGMVPPGGSVIVIQSSKDPTNLAHHYERLTLIRGVQPGDQLLAGRSKRPGNRSGFTSSMSASYNLVSGSSSNPYLFAACPETSSGNLGAPISLVFYDGCITPTFDLLSLQDSTTTRFYVWQQGLAYAPGTTIAIPNTWQPLGQSTTTLPGTPPGLTRVFVQLDAVVGGVPREMDRRGVEAPAAGTNSVSLRYAPNAAPTLLTASSVRGLDIIDRHARMITADATAATIDLAALPLPSIVTVTPNQSGMTWTESGSGVPDARILLWGAQWVDSNQVRHDAVWEVLEPADASRTLVLPSLPPEHSEKDPTVILDPMNPPTIIAVGVRYVDYDNLADYNAARPHGAELTDLGSRFLTIPHEAHVTLGGR